MLQNFRSRLESTAITDVGDVSSDNFISLVKPSLSAE